CLSEMRDIDDRGNARDQARQNISKTHSPRDRDTRVARARRIEADGIPGTSDRRTMQQDDVSGKYQNENRQLHRNNAANVALTENEERLWKVCVVHRGVSDSFGDSTKQRKRSQRHDEWRKIEPRNQKCV